jgi:hypothetical protein
MYSTLLHLPPFRFHCVGGCCDRTQDCCDFATVLGTFTSALKDIKSLMIKKSQNCSCKLFLFSCLLMEGSGSRSVQIIADPDHGGPKDKGSGSGKNHTTQWIIKVELKKRGRIIFSGAGRRKAGSGNRRYRNISFFLKGFVYCSTNLWAFL